LLSLPQGITQELCNPPTIVKSHPHLAELPVPGLDLILFRRHIPRAQRHLDLKHCSTAIAPPLQTVVRGLGVKACCPQLYIFQTNPSPKGIEKKASPGRV
jgi:hypothetical protein